ncbi:voltage-dependent calcium channel subunit alpha-2/delta-3-like protein [Leptotrombidium deliense]|uniref:Voltage-dependent calcium channel subunit alpha-2/delta-3-like protein n=1 Tax=Leptotrombidium deliense TaxID=299467 RepID=A0A443SJM8_9ACAR|nr:voltage-dependent calcium channel subunit alpha-2/delta-3-like protein [Leptotrombidium deliense]
MHLDSMKRVVTRTNVYAYAPIDETPFSLGIAIPEAYGTNRIANKIDMHTANIKSYFEEKNWKVHPDWYYCIDNPINSLYERDNNIKTPEEGITFVLDRLSQSTDSAIFVNSRLFPYENKENKVLCDKLLFESLVYDAKVTRLNTGSCDALKGAKLSDPLEKHNFTAEEIFADTHNKAVDEIFYQRAVDYYQIDANAFLFSVPFETHEVLPTYVTASKALFFGSGNKKAPAAVSGVLFNHAKFTDYFFGLTNLCSKVECEGDNCTKGLTNCYLLDNNAFIFVSQIASETGKFIGEIDSNLLKSLVEKNVYKEIEIFDYQAICIQDLNKKSLDNAFEPLKTPFSIFKNIIVWMISRIYTVAVNFMITSFESMLTNAEYYNDYDSDYETHTSGFPKDEKGKPMTPNKTKPYPCDKRFKLYERQKWQSNDPSRGTYKCEDGECEQEYFVKSIENTNLILVVVKSLCQCESKVKISPERIIYGENHDEENCAEKQHFLIKPEKPRIRPNLSCINSHPQNYNENGVEVRQEEPSEILKQFVADIKELLHSKREHVRRIAEKAEAASAEHDFDPKLVFNFFNSKKLYEANENVDTFIKKNVPYLDKIREEEANAIYRDIPVSLNHSAVHIPVNVFNEKPTVMNSIKWSEALLLTFKQNKNTDSDLYWQYFCSNDGFLRLYPAAKWRSPLYMQNPDEDTIPLDLYDCRLRKWYTKAAASPKDVVILLDRSGSMTGQRKEISRNVVVNILESLTEDDFVAILGFNNTVAKIVDCFGNRLVQANKQNIRTFRENLGEMDTNDIANFTQALRDAFDILDEARRNGEGSQCNQAIMLVTDGAPETYKEIFEEYNGPLDQFGQKRVPVRVFTYLIGKEVTDTEEVHQIACHNKGYYTHVANNAEVREQVQLYIPVMSRPIVLSKERPFIYTNVYTDVSSVTFFAYPLVEYLGTPGEYQYMFSFLIYASNIICKTGNS